MKKLVLILGIFVGMAHGQIQYPYILNPPVTPPSGACAGPQIQVLATNGHIYTCDNGTWTDITAAGPGTVTNVTGTANQIDVATGTTTPVISLDPSLILPTGTTLVAPALGTPASGLITNLTGTCSTCVANSATLSAPIASPTFTGTATAPLVVVTGNGAASVSPLLMNGTILTGGTGTTNFPALFIQPAGTTAATTWSTAGTGWGMNAPSGFTGNVLDYHLNGAASVFNVNSTGQLSANGVRLGNLARTIDTTTGSNLIIGVNSNPVSANVDWGSSATGFLHVYSSGFVSVGTKFTATGCTSITSTVGGATAGKFTIGANSCTVVITMNGATGLTAPNGWACDATDLTTSAGNTGLLFLSDNATTATLTVPVTAAASDVIRFKCGGY